MEEKHIWSNNKSQPMDLMGNNFDGSCFFEQSLGQSPVVKTSWDNYVFSAIITSIIAIFFVFVYEDCRHWCIMPIMLCGSLIGSDLIRWFRKQLDPFDPKAVVAAFLYVNCFFAPMLHLSNNIHHVKFYVLQNWPLYFSYMAFFNIAGIILLKLAHKLSFKGTREVKKIWEIAPGNFIVVLLPILTISLIASGVIKIFFGGLSKEVGVYSLAAGTEAYASHLSWIMMLGDPFPLLIVMTIIFWLYQKQPGKPKSLMLIIIVLIITFAVQFIFVGVRGSRTGILSVVFFITAMIHFRLRRFTMKFLLIGIVFVFIFSYLYDFYKKVGSEGWAVFYSAEARERLSYERGGVTFTTTLMFDLARADVQTFMLYRLMENDKSHDYVFGQTYLMSGLTFIPRGIWKNKPTPKVTAGGQILGYPALQKSSHQYGLAGEAMLNFGYYGILPAYFALGLFLGWLRKKIATLHPVDSRFFLLPFILFTCTFVVISDSDNLVQHLLRMATLPFIVVFWGSSKYEMEINNY